MVRIIIAGGRDFVPTDASEAHLRATLERLPITTTLSGKARGADAHGEYVAKSMGIPVEDHPADWDRYGRRMAGRIRNTEMARSADAVYLFPGGSGTKHMEEEAIAYGLLIFRYPEEDENV